MPPVRIAVLADIHGNADALRAVLVIVNGDVVNRGPDSVEVMHLLLERDDVSFVLGNHDDLLRLWHTRSEKLPQDWYADPFWGATAWSTEQLHAAGLLDVPQDWAPTLRLSESGLPDILISHGTPERTQRPRAGSPDCRGARCGRAHRLAHPPSGRRGGGRRAGAEHRRGRFPGRRRPPRTVPAAHANAARLGRATAPRAL